MLPYGGTSVPLTAQNDTYMGCTASSNAPTKDCAKAFDGLGYGLGATSWTPPGSTVCNNAVGQWIKVNFKKVVLVAHMVWTQASGQNVGKIKDIKLEFSDGSYETVTLPVPTNTQLSCPNLLLTI